MNKLIYPEVGSKILPAKKLIVLLHGIGANGNDLIDLVQYIQDDLEDCHFMAPHGVEPYDQAAYGRQWFSLQDRTPHVMQRLLHNNVAALMEIIVQKQTVLNLTNKDTIVVGFSQGTIMGLYITLIQAEPFLGMIGFSGLLVPPPCCINTTTPVCLLHGALDQVITIDAMDHAMQYLAKHRIPHSGYRLQGLAHSIDSSGLKYAIEFIKRYLFTCVAGFRVLKK